MPDRMNTIAGAPCWVELVSSDVSRSLDFYGAVFGWQPVASDEEILAGYVTFLLDGKKVAGVAKQHPGSELADTWLNFLLTPDAAAAAIAVEEAGGSVMFPPQRYGDAGTMGVVQDTGGAAIGLMQPGSHHGFEVSGQHTSVVWQELMTRDFAGSLAFYEEVFGWSTELMGDTDSFRYTRFMSGGEPQAGIMDATRWLPDGAASRWQVYFGVNDVDDTVARVVRQGGTVVAAAEDTPYGRNAGVTDSTGAYFLLSSSVQPSSVV